MGLFQTKLGTVFLKENSDSSEYILKLEQLKKNAREDLRREIESQIRLAKYGEQGENNIAFELKNSGMNMFVLRDLYLEIDGMSAQIDYMVVTRKIIFVIECKNLYGNIKIDNKGAFIRILENGEEKGMYSPVTQNERHLQVIKKVRAASKNIIGKMIFEKYFEKNYKSIVVLANPQTVLYDRYAPKEIKQQVIRYDQLIKYIKKMNDESDISSYSIEEMTKVAEFFRDIAISKKSDYAVRYEELVEAERKAVEVLEEKPKWKKKEFEKDEKEDTGNESLVHKLKQYRLRESRKNNIKPYYIFNDAQMEDLIQKNPKNEQELLNVAGFGPAKVDKYGSDILKILSEQ